MKAGTALALAAAALPLVSAAPTKRDSNYKNIVYWGVSSNNELSHYCTPDSGIDIIIISFLYSFGGGNYPNTGNTNTNFIGPDGCQIYENQSASNCDSIASAIPQCQANGIQVFMGVGGGGAQYQITGDNDASGIAYSLWNSYANPAVTASGSFRPFGNSFVNGWDFDIESDDGSQAYLGTLINSLRGYFGDDSSNSYYISGAPQCVIPDANMGNSLMQAQYDYVNIQFYNNNCAANDLFASGNPEGESGFNLNDWPGYLSGGASSNAQLMVGLTGDSSEGDSFDYVQPSNLGSLISQSQQDAGNFGGIMIFDAGDSDTSENTPNGETYAQAVKNALNNA